MRIIIVFFASLLLFACNEQKKDKIFEQTPKDKTYKNEVKIKSGLQEIERLSFRRSYAGHENLSGKALEKLHTSNPALETFDSSTKIFKKLNQLNILTSFDLVLSGFKDKKLGTQYLDNNRKIEITCNYDSLTMSKIDLAVTNENKKDLKTLDFNGDHIIGIILKDIDDDNVKEILVLTNYYIMNGDNYVLTILKYI
ncbi:hypothetical protein [Ferruginibacter sp. HRS2-29]|uniref:hypothetical protein n=1 Tax=Ferruginibacter sp. HRS2-29 TaxID=2487334 RepID=UPI0020CC8765|nr:hypothetical protein [Ferruginibacter sp. HRS2-29]MCP9753500.1 hypothetical protein [Ferruginibacter sp. HRS2-29]